MHYHCHKSKDFPKCADQSSRLKALLLTYLLVYLISWADKWKPKGSEYFAELKIQCGCQKFSKGNLCACMGAWVTHKVTSQLTHTHHTAVVALDCALVTWSAITPDNCINKTIFLPLLLCHSPQLPPALLHQFTAFPGTLSSNESQVSVWSLSTVSLCTLPSSFVPFPIFSLSILFSPSRKGGEPAGPVVDLANRNAP